MSRHSETIFTGHTRYSLPILNSRTHLNTNLNMNIRRETIPIFKFISTNVQPYQYKPNFPPSPHPTFPPISSRINVHVSFCEIFYPKLMWVFEKVLLGEEAWIYQGMSGLFFLFPEQMGHVDV